MVQLIKAAHGNINTRHGEQIGRGFPHVGIDIGWGGGLELYAPADGWLSWSWAGSYGNLAVITHSDGSRSRIAHADSYSGFNGRNVKQGEHIGTMGKSGGPWGTSGWFVHCHQEYWVDGVAVNPLDYMGASTAGDAPTLITSGETDMKHIFHPDRGYAIIWDEGAYGYPDTDIDAIVAKGIEPSIIYDHAWQWDTEVREANIRGDAMRALQTKHTIAALKVAGLPVDIDEAALGKQIAGLLPTPSLDSIKIAKATADEIDARNRARLGK